MRRSVSVVAIAALMVSGGCGEPAPHSAPPRVLVLGIDGMDPKLLQELIDAGRMESFRRLAASGGFLDLATSAPAQSPVAWSNFITGAGPATHRIFDFIHRDSDLVPYLSTSTIEPPARDWAIPAGRWRIPLAAAKPTLLRRGTPFWNHLAEAGVPVTIFRMPANYPPVAIDGVRCLCGMGTPDLLGTYGLFTFFSSDPAVRNRPASGGRFVRLRMDDDRGVGLLPGPDNFLRAPDERGRRPAMATAIKITRDAERGVARLIIGDEILLLNEGEWSAWTPVEFATGITGATILEVLQVPTVARGMVRFYLKATHPHVELYVSPVNIDPRKAVTSIAAPDSFAADIAATCGPYHTTGIPEDTKALRAGALDEEEFLAQIDALKAERLRQYRHALAEFEAGFLFFYFGHVDQLSHIFWRDRDPGHPAHDPAEALRFGRVVEDAYVEMDALVGEALARLGPDDTLLVMSDHGFESFRRGFHLNRWLQSKGFLAVHDQSRQEHDEYLSGIDWKRTRAYALGLNGLYVNLVGREPRGMVTPGVKRRALLDRIAKGLLAVRDEMGHPVIARVDVVDDIYPGADREVAPDLLIGYARGYRASWATAEGRVPRTLIEDNHERWSGDHCIGHDLVPGILLTNRAIRERGPDLRDLAPTILGCYGLAVPPEMTGRDLFRAAPTTDEVHTAGAP